MHSFHFAFAGVVVKFKPEESVGSMAVFTQQHRSRRSQEAVGGITFKIFSLVCAARIRVSLMGIMACRA